MRLPLPGRGRPRRGDPQYAVWEFARDVDRSRFTDLGWWVLTTLVAVGAAWVAAQAGIPAGLGIIAAGTVVWALAAVGLEQRRWHAQDVMYWYQAARAADWLRDTGSPVMPSFDAAGNEVWLGVHQPGTVPQVYRALAATSTRNPVVIARELAAMPDATPLDRANRLWVEAGTWDHAAADDLSELRTAVTALPAGRERTMFEGYLAHVDALRRHRDGARDWLAPLAALRAGFPRASLGRRLTFRMVLGRFAPAVWLAIFGTAFVFTLSPLWGPVIPSSYAKTEISTRGDLPKEPDDWNRMWLALPSVADALPAARHEGSADRLEGRWYDLIDAGMPTLIWDVHAISLAPPADAAGRKVTQVEILMGSSSASHGWVIVTFDTFDGPTELYDLSPSVVRTLQDLFGVTPAGG